MKSSTVVNASIRRDNTGLKLILPVIVTSEGILKSYLNYLVLNRSRSRSWIDRSVFAMRLLLDYVDAHSGVFEHPKKMFVEFSNTLFTGSIGNNHNDPSGLYWRPRKPSDARNLINLITHYCQWLSERNEDSRLQLNPWRKASPYEQKLNWAAYHQKKSRAFLSHLFQMDEAKKENAKSRNVSGFLPAEPNTGVFDPAKAFPKAYTNALFHIGFVKPGKEHEKALYKRLNLRDVLVTMLMRFGGLRLSEVFHIYVEDIAPIKQGEDFVVKVYHPQLGASPDKRFSNRREYLNQVYGLKPRNEYPKGKKVHAGWKNPKITHKKGMFFTVFFFPSDAGRYFYELWKLYLKYQRVAPKPGNRHPYAFTTRDGTPHTKDSYESSRKRAVKRIGLNYSKADCTTPHCDRHALGVDLAEAGVSPMIIRDVLHHHSLESQTVYTSPSEEHIRKTLAGMEPNTLLPRFTESLKLESY